MFKITCIHKQNHGKSEMRNRREENSAISHDTNEWHQGKKSSAHAEKVHMSRPRSITDWLEVMYHTHEPRDDACAAPRYAI